MKFNKVLLCWSGVFLLLSRVIGGIDVCPHKLGDLGNKNTPAAHWKRCDSDADCPVDKVCSSPVNRLPGLWICVKKPCHSHGDCKQGLYCYKKYSYGHPTIDWSVRGTCCEIF